MTVIIVRIDDPTATSDEAVRRGVMYALSHTYSGFATFTTELPCTCERPKDNHVGLPNPSVPTAK